MAIRKYNPTSPGTRFQTVAVFDEITTQEPHKPLVEPLHESGGRNNAGQLTSWWRGGGHERMYRIIDFKRDKLDIPAKVSTIEYDPNRSARIALLTYADGEKRYILQPVGLKVGDTIVSGQSVDILQGNALPMRVRPRRTAVVPGRGRLGVVRRAEHRVAAAAGQVDLGADGRDLLGLDVDLVFAPQAVLSRARPCSVRAVVMEWASQRIPLLACMTSQPVSSSRRW